MKRKLLLSSLLICLIQNLFAQPGGPTGAPYTVVERGPHQRVMQSMSFQTNELGAVSVSTNSYTELATGMYYVNDEGQWAESREEIEILPRGAGAAARHGQYKVIFPSDIYDGAIQMY